MTKDEQRKLLRIGAIALEVAAWPTEAADRATGSRNGIPKRLIGELRIALEDYGVDWRKFRKENRS